MGIFDEQRDLWTAAEGVQTPGEALSDSIDPLATVNTSNVDTPTKKSKSTVGILPAGPTVLPFSYILPNDLPRSYEPPEEHCRERQHQQMLWKRTPPPLCRVRYTVDVQIHN